MTREELSRLYWLKKRIEFDSHRLMELRSAAEAITPKLSGMPRGQGDPHSAEAIKIELAEQAELVELQVRQMEIERKRIDKWISGIQDPLVYMVLYSRYVDGLSWNKIALKIGGGNTEQSVRHLARRYVEKNLK